MKPQYNIIKQKIVECLNLNLAESSLKWREIPCINEDDSPDHTFLCFEISMPELGDFTIDIELIENGISFLFCGSYCDAENKKKLTINSIESLTIVVNMFLDILIDIQENEEDNNWQNANNKLFSAGGWL